jgi:3-hydroxyisobutyrate dehydrogenase
MGGGMAARLVSAGFRTTVWNRHAERAGRLRDLGATIAASPREASATADVIVSMVADDPASRAVWLGDEGALAEARAGTLAIECSTLTPAWVEELQRAATARGVSVLDAPVTGSRIQAGNGELRFLVGGDAAALDRARPILAAMGKEIVHLGPVGSGARMKLINNFLCGAQAAALAEAVALIERSGLNRDTALTILQNGAPVSPLVAVVSKRMMAKDYSVNFKLALMRKDLGYAIEDGRRFHLPLTTAEQARAMFDKATAEWGEADFSAVIEPLRASRN